MKIDCVFSGGGIKAYALVGALDSIENRNLEIIRVAGTSAGAIVASFIAAGFKVDEMKQILNELNLKDFLDAPFLMNKLPLSKWIYLYFKMGIYKGDALEQWVAEKLAEKNVFTFKDLNYGSLKIIVSDISMGKLVVIPDDLYRFYKLNPNDFSVAKAVRMSASFPYFFQPVKMFGDHNQESMIVDGGLLSNFPIWVFGSCYEKQIRPVLGVKLSSKGNPDYKKEISNAWQMTQAMFKTMKVAHDARYLTTLEQKNIIFIPVQNVMSMDFSLSEQDKQMLFDLGKECAEDFLKHWPT